MAPPRDDPRPLLLFDGVCNLCNESVNWIIDHDPHGRFRFAALQSEAAEPLLARHGLEGAALESVVLIAAGRVYRKSDAVLEVVRRLGGGWSFLVPLRHVPRPLRDAAYDAVARSRYRLFGRRTTCRVPTPELLGRFL